MAEAQDVMDSKEYSKGQNVFEIETDALNFTNNVEEEKTYVIPTSRYAEEYNMGLAKRGKALLFHHTKFDPRLGLSERIGSKADKKALKEAVLHLGFDENDITEYEDLTINQLKDALKKVAAMDHKEHDCLLVAICTHGQSAHVIYVWDGLFFTEDLWEPFVGGKCITLAGKPKMFFIQACRGPEVDEGVAVDSYDQVDSTVVRHKIPSYADLLIYHSSFPGYLSWRNPINGTPFIQSLCKILKEKGHSKNLLSLLTVVNHRVAYEFSSNVVEDPAMHKKQIPCISSMLTREVIFKPKTSVKPPESQENGVTRFSRPL